MNDETSCDICDHKNVCYLRRVVNIDSVTLYDFCKHFIKKDPDLKPIFEK